MSTTSNRQPVTTMARELRAFHCIIGAFALVDDSRRATHNPRK